MLITLFFERFWRGFKHYEGLSNNIIVFRSIVLCNERTNWSLWYDDDRSDRVGAMYVCGAKLVKSTDNQLGFINN